ncbi:DUF3237 domain-containing protein [Arthrobacter sp. GCM10027362]|uniref:DUF3237 domain-containing protein n=1 Tax=Arthrobacter sp. GCM10027362 TaxID=3273379 RepID=UPI003641F1B7
MITPELDYLATLTVRVGGPADIGPGPAGYRRIIPILGGVVDGPALKGKVLPYGADFQLLKSDTVTELEAKYAIETDDGERIYIENFGLRTGSKEDIESLLRGEKVDPARIYFRCAPKFTAAGKWEWLNSKILVGTGERHPDSVVVNVFVVN